MLMLDQEKDSRKGWEYFNSKIHYVKTLEFVRSEDFDLDSCKKNMSDYLL